MTRKLALVAVAVTILTVLAGGVALAGGGGSLCAGFRDGDSVVLRDSCLEGTAHFLTAGDELTVRNLGEMAHEYVAVDGSFGTDVLQPGESQTVTVPEPGVYRVYCSLHSNAEGDGMAGVLIAGEPDVAGAATASSADAASSATLLDRVTQGGPAATVVALSVLALAAVVVALLARPRAVSRTGS